MTTPIPLSRRILKEWVSIKSEYDQEIPQSHTADQTKTSRGIATEHKTSQ